MTKTIKKSLALLLSILMLMSVVPMGISFAADSDYTYTVTDEKVTITKYTGSDEELVIPDTLGGYPVVAIGERAFRNNSSIKKIRFADSIETIGNLAFYQCKTLEEVNLGNGVKTLVGSSFSNCGTIGTLIIGKSLAVVGTNTFNGTTIDTIKYKGTSEEWSAITVETGNNRFEIATIVFNYCEHNIVNVPAVAAKCEESGNIEYWTCTLCNKIYSDATATTEITDTTVPAVGHNEKVIPAVEATCEGTGLTEGKQCETCGKITVAQETVGAKGHEIVFNGPGTITVITPAKCTEEGVGSAYCHRCKTDINVRLGAKGHSYSSVITAPTCVEAGYTTFTCTSCDDTYKANEVDATGHSPAEAVKENVTSATCTTNGSYDSVVKCSTCNAELSRTPTTIEHSGHKFSELPEDTEVVNEATCTATGLNKVLCTACDEKIEVVVPMKDHSYVTAPYEAPTCTENGKNGGTWCSVCKVYTVNPETIPALGHDYVVDPAKTYEADCENKGYIYKDCSRCDAYEIETPAALGHIIKTVDGVAATCTTAGYEAYEYCTREDCDYDTYEEIPAPGHTPGAEATCTEAQICTVCKEVLVKALGHDVVIIDAEPASCTETGLTEGECCARCNAELKEQYIIPATGHETEKLSAEPVTCTEDGLTEGLKCTVCNTVVVEQKVITSPGHIRVTLEAVSPTCENPGKTAGIGCKNCDVIFDEPRLIEAYGHNIVPVKGYDATCTEAGRSDGKKCNRIGCDYVEVPQEEIPATGHNMQKTADKIEPTCTAAGKEEVRTCANNCGETEGGEEIAKLDHIAGAAATCTAPQTCLTCEYVFAQAVGHAPGVAATCTAPQTCTTCAAIITPVLEHDIEYDAVTQAATCYSDGREKGKCKNCDYKFDNKLPATGHNVQNWTTIIVPTCKETGKAVGLCLNCKYTIENKLSTVDHQDVNPVDNKCDFCGKLLGSIDIIPDDKEEEKEEDEKCNCNCHAIGIRGLIFDFILFLQRLFGLNKTCKCGVAHY